MIVKDRQKWDKCVEENQGIFEQAGIRFAIAWASMMEGELAKGKSIPESIAECRYNADIEGITEDIYKNAVLMLLEHWEHNEILRSLVTSSGCVSFIKEI